MHPVSTLVESLAVENRLLAALARREFERLSRHMETTHLSYKEILHEPGAPVAHVYFPLDALVCLLSIGEEGATVEVGMVGSEGMVGAPILLGGDTAPSQAVVLSPGSAVRLKADVVKKEFKRSRALQDLLLPYAHALLTQSAQSAACHRFHTPVERLCRWLLMAHDRAGSDEFRVTQEFISDMLGTRRATVTEAAHALQQKGVIDYFRGRIAIRDRRGLETLACRCYQVTKEEFDN